MGLVIGVLVTYIPMFLKNAVGLDIMEVGLLLTVMLGGAVVGGFTFGRISDLIGRKKTVVVVLLLAAPLLYSLTLGFQAIVNGLTKENLELRRRIQETEERLNRMRGMFYDNLPLIA